MVFSEKYLLKKHRHVHSTKERKHKCHDCGKSYSKKSNLKRHRENKHSSEGNKIKKYKCDDCDLHFLYKRELKTHQLIAHSEWDFFYNCYHCGYGTNLKNDLKKHLKHEH